MNQHITIYCEYLMLVCNQKKNFFSFHFQDNLNCISNEITTTKKNIAHAMITLTKQCLRCNVTSDGDGGGYDNFVSVLFFVSLLIDFTAQGFWMLNLFYGAVKIYIYLIGFHVHVSRWMVGFGMHTIFFFLFAYFECRTCNEVAVWLK